MMIRTKKPKSSKFLKKILKRFNNVTKEPETFLSVQPDKTKEIKLILGELYSFSVQQNGNKDPNILPELVLDGMDEEQIWQQLELFNNSIWPELSERTSRILATKDEDFLLPLESNDNENTGGVHSETEKDTSLMGSGNEDLGEESEDDIGAEFHKNAAANKKTKKRKSVVDDKFFKLSEMEEFLNIEDEREKQRQKGLLKDNEEEIDYFNDNLSDEDDENLKYEDFFDKEEEEEELSEGILDNKRENRTKKREHNEGSSVDEEEHDEEIEEELSDNEDEEDEDLQENKHKSNEEFTSDEEDQTENGDEPKSSFELRQERLKRRIQELEERALGEKPWQLKGEITATSRPQNSLLEEVLQFDPTARPPPVITEETTHRLEDIIKQRIKDKAWDDVERIVKPVQTPQEFRKKLVLDQEKSKESLAQIYEKEYRKELEKLNPNNDEQQEEPRAHREIKDMMKNLFIKLDALSNFHFTPKPVAPELRVITNTPAITMEEVAPVAVSDAKLLAPEEVKQHAKGDVLGKSERSKTDKNRERRKKKLKQKAIYKARQERDLEKQKMGIKLSNKEEKDKALRTVIKSRNVQKMSVSADGNSLKSSKAFFNQLQDKASSKSSKQHKKAEKEGISAKRLKL